MWIFIHGKNLPNPKMILYATFKDLKVNTFYDCGILKTWSRSDWHAIKGLVIMHLGYLYQVCTLNDICPSHWSLWKYSTLTEKWGCSDLILGISCGNHLCLKFPQVWCGTLDQVVSKLHAYSVENPLIFTENDHCCCDLESWSGDVCYVVLQ